MAKDERENLDHDRSGGLATANVLAGFGISPSKGLRVWSLFFRR
jgi:hypothetical protein